MNTITTQSWFTYEEAARASNRSVRTIQRWRDMGRLPVRYINGTGIPRIRAVDLAMAQRGRSLRQKRPAQRSR